MLQFGLFDEICNSAPLPLCNLISLPHLNGPRCYARSIEIGSTLIFQPATIVVQMIALLMTMVMIYNIKIKYTAVGRKEMVMFFYLYMLMLISEFLVISGMITVGSKLYPYFVAGYYAMISATISCLMLNGFVGFQFTEDGTFWSVWSIRLVSFIITGLAYMISLGTFMDIGLSKNYPSVLWIWIFLLQGLALFIYSILQIILVVNTLDIFWPIGNIILGLLFFLGGQLFLHSLSSEICHELGHYIDGMFLYVICTLLSVMMIYKYWDSITKEDLEFSVSNNQNIWEVKDLSDHSPRNSIHQFDLSNPLSASIPSQPLSPSYGSSFIAALNITNLPPQPNGLSKITSKLLSPTTSPRLKLSS